MKSVSCDFQGLTAAARLLPISRMKCHVQMPEHRTGFIRERCTHEVESPQEVLVWAKGECFPPFRKVSIHKSALSQENQR